jgi:hypothetical protein
MNALEIEDSIFTEIIRSNECFEEGKIKEGLEIVLYMRKMYSKIIEDYKTSKLQEIENIKSFDKSNEAYSVLMKEVDKLTLILYAGGNIPKSVYEEYQIKQ